MSKLEQFDDVERYLILRALKRLRVETKAQYKKSRPNNRHFVQYRKYTLERLDLLVYLFSQQDALPCSQETLSP